MRIPRLIDGVYRPVETRRRRLICASRSSRAVSAGGCQLFCDLGEHGERRGARGMANLGPTKLNRPLLRDGWPLEEDFLTGGMPPDDYIHCNITQKQDWVGPYRHPTYFCCGGDERQ